MNKKELVILLNKVEDSYYDFIVGVLSYAMKKESRYNNVKNYILNNKKATSSDIIKFIFDQPDFYEDMVCDTEKVI